MSTYRNNYFANFESSCVTRGDGWAAFVGCGWAACPAYSPTGLAECLHIGAERYDHVAPGFEYALDAPIRIPAGSMVAAARQPYMD